MTTAPTFSVSDLVKDTSSTGGTGNLTLSGTPTAPYISFNSAFGTNVYFPYVIKNSTDYEAGYAYLSASTTFVRAIVTASSNAGAAVNWPASAVDIYSAVHADYLMNMPMMGQSLAVSLGIAMP